MSREIVIDCSVTGAWFIPDEANAVADKLLQHALERDVNLVAPTLWYYEMINLLRSAIRRKRLLTTDGRRALGLLQEIPVQLVAPAFRQADELLDLAVKWDLSAYDAAYLQLADSLDAPLLTQDEAMLKLRTHFPLIRNPLCEVY